LVLLQIKTEYFLKINVLSSSTKVRRSRVCVFHVGPSHVINDKKYDATFTWKQYAKRNVTYVLFSLIKPEDRLSKSLNLRTLVSTSLRFVQNTVR